MGLDINKLDSSVKWSLQKLEKYRATATKAVTQYVGSHYGEGGSSKRVPVNLLELATTISYENICQYAKSLWRFPHQSRLLDISLSPIRNVGRHCFEA